jgi:FAD/FMN-containing dehydrogenase
MAPANSNEAGWQNWSGSVSCSPRRIERPEDEEAVAALVARASTAGSEVRVVGTGHSHSPLVATDGVLLSLDDLAGIESHDRAELHASVRAGTKLCDLGDPLLERGLGMKNLGDIDKQALAGAVGTGTHGTGRTLGNISSSVEGARVVDAEGAIRSFGMGSGEADPDVLPGLRVSLGALGVFTALRIRLLPAYRLHERIRRMPIDDCLGRLDQEVRDNRHFEFFWLPGRDAAEMKTLNPTDEPASDLPDEPYQRIGWSPHIITSVRDVKHFEMEYAVPAEHGPDCFREVRGRMQERHPDVQWPVEYRTVAPDDAWLSTAHGRDTVTISVHQDGTLPYRDFFRDVEPIFWSCAGRPHWGKIHTLTAPRLRDLYPEWDRFQALRERLDPKGRFLNPHLRELFGI